jgi:hypothetical protein
VRECRAFSFGILPFFGPILGTTLAYEPRVRVQKPAARGILGALILSTAIAAVGLTAPTDSLFSIAVEPVFLRLGINVDIKLGSLHLHASWSALDRAAPVRQPDEPLSSPWAQ